MPSKKEEIGSLHPITKLIDGVKEIFIGLGYQIADGPEIEYAEYNFDKLNTPKDHPSRDLQDTMYITDNIVLRSQTSPMQAKICIRDSLFTGIRIVEVLALKLQDIDIDLNYISVNQTMTKDKHDKIIIGNTPKTKTGKRKIKVLSQAKPILENSIKELLSLIHI